MKELLKKCLVEFIGAFFLIFTIGCSSFPNGQDVFPPMAIGFILMVMVYAGGHVSGGHYNPAVSLSAAIRGALPWKDFVYYCTIYRWRISSIFDIIHRCNTSSSCRINIFNYTYDYL